MPLNGIPLVLFQLGHFTQEEGFHLFIREPSYFAFQTFPFFFDCLPGSLRGRHMGGRLLGNGQGFSVKQVIETVREITGHPIPAKSGQRRAGDPDVLVAGSQRIRDELGWKPQFPNLRDIIESAWRWHEQHPDGYVS
jgi:hypothetical protein